MRAPKPFLVFDSSLDTLNPHVTLVLAPPGLARTTESVFRFCSYIGGGESKAEHANFGHVV